MRTPHIIVNSYLVDPEEAHIVLNTQIDPEIFALLQQICPAGLYWQDEHGQHYDYTGCLECGACRIIGDTGTFAVWHFPRGSFGIDYKY